MGKRKKRSRPPGPEVIHRIPSFSYQRDNPEIVIEPPKLAEQDPYGQSEIQSGVNPATEPAAATERDQAPTELDIGTVPFLTWNVRRGHKNQKDTDPNNVATPTTLIRILDNIHKSLCSRDERLSKIYSRSFKCTLDDLRNRHATLMPEEACTPQEAPTTNFSNSRGEDDRMPGTPFQTSSASTEAQQKPLHETQADEQLLQDKDSKPGPMGLIISLIKELVEKAHDFFYDLPKDDTPSHILCERYWGAVDTIIRVRLDDVRTLDDR
jgi:hypothetical protein